MSPHSCLPFLIALLTTAAATAQSNQRTYQIMLHSRPSGSPFFGQVAVVGDSLAQPGSQPFAPIDTSGTYPLVPGTEYRIELSAAAYCSPDFQANVSLGQQFSARLEAVFDPPSAVVWATMNHQHNTGGGIAGQPYHAYTSTGSILPWQDASSGSHNGHSASGSTSIALVPTGSGPSALTLVADGEVNSLAETSSFPWPSAAAYGAFSTIEFTVTQAMALSMQVVTGGEVRGESQGYPILPILPPFGFSGATRAWYDPPLALGFDFAMTGSSLFTEILSLPVGIDGDGLFEVWVGSASLGWFAAGSSVDFQTLLGGSGVAAFRITGIDPAADATDDEAFPVQLAFDTPTAEFTMTPVLWRKVGSSCSDPVCAPCTAIELAPNGPAIEGGLGFGFDLANGPTGGAAAVFLGFGTANPAPIPFLCGDVVLPPLNGIFHVGTTALTGSASCDGAGFVSLPLVPTPPLVGLFLTVQAVTLCPAGGLGLTHGVEFAIGD